ncbi:putative Xaa-Pro aminopeptidase [Amylocarpus encephaloides]|uniref:Xaa-Pro aminopeptidase n=1 Tax=Amylocarpus encephaloides TaxID=45428 RepID=A0A9P7YEL5_9HELO|nr:putative Xaa-Pro aminopeptidase [Amylocarpus encephaloides]
MTTNLQYHVTRLCPASGWRFEEVDFKCCISGLATIQHTNIRITNYTLATRIALDHIRRTTLLQFRPTSHPPIAATMEVDAQTEWSFVDEVECDAVLVDFKGEGKYPAKLHARRVAKHLGVKQGLIYLPGTPSMTYEDSDNEAAFRQRRYFYYISGLDYPDCVVTYNIESDGLYVWIPPPNTGRSVIYNGTNPTEEEIKAISDFDFVSRTTHLQQYLMFFTTHKKGDIFLLHDYQAPEIAEKIECREGTSKTTKGRFDATNLKPAMNAARVIKTPFEIQRIRKANAITTKAHINVLRSIRHLENEAEIEGIFTGTCIASQAKNQSYGPIAGSGRNAGTLHYGANNEPLKGRQLVCLDAGCDWKNYASDVTRSFPISGKWTKEAKQIYDLVALMQEECISMVKPGADYRRIDMHAHEVATKGLMKLGLLQNGSYQELFRSGVSTCFLPHGLGHYMGLEVHDVGAHGALLYFRKYDSNTERPEEAWKRSYLQMLSDLSSASPSLLEENMVITVEPGIYFNQWAFESVYLHDPRMAKYINQDLLTAYYPVGGVRIEDDLLVRRDGYENLTTAPKGDEALRIILGEDGEGAADEEKSGRRGWLW